MNVRLGYGLRLSPVELGLLEGMALLRKRQMARDESDRIAVDDVVRWLGLSKRLTLDLIADLWRKNYVTLDPSTGEVRVTPDVARRYEEKTLHELPGAEVSAAEKELMVDKLGGRVLPVGGTLRPVNGHIAVPVENSKVSIDDVPVPQLVAAIEETLRREQQDEKRPGREQQVLAAHVPPRALRKKRETRWVPLEVQVGTDDMTSRLRIRVLDDRYPLTYRERAATQLATLVEKYPNTPFARSLRAQADSAYKEPPSLEDAMDRLEKAAAKTETIPAGKRREHHLDLCDQARRLDTLYDVRASMQVRCRVLSDVTSHTECVRDLIGAAKRQIVVVTPIVEYRQLHSLVDALRKRLAQGVRLVLVWGTRPGEELHPRVLELLADLSEEFPERVVWSTHPSRTNACLVIADDRIALISGCPPLRTVNPAEKGGQARGSGGRELGLRIVAASSGPCPPLEALLEWARKAIPDYLVSTMVQIRHGDFSDVRTPASARPLELPADPTDSDVAFWREAWIRYARSFRQKVSASASPWAEVVYDEAHRHLLSDALRSAERRILISSRRIGFEMGGTRLDDAVRAPLLRGVGVTVLHGEDHTAEASTPGVLWSLREQFPDELLTERRDTNARVLVFDEQVVVGSFDPLSGGSGAPHRRRSDIGIKIAGGEIAGEVMAALRVETAAVSPHPEEISPSELVATAVSAQVLFGALREVASDDEPARAAVIRVHIDDTGEAMAWSLLNDLESKNVDAGVLRVAAAHVLRRAPAAERAGRWWRWLMLERWHAEAFVEAAVLRDTIADPDMRPRRILTAVAAARGHAEFADSIAEAVLSDPTEAEKAVLATVGTAEVLLATLDEHAEAADQALELLADELGEPWREMTAIARNHWATVHRPLPLGHILAESDAEHQRADLAGAWRDLALRLQRVERTTFRFASSVKTHARLFRDDGPFGLLRPVIERRGIAALRSWLSTQPVDDVRALVHEIGAEVQQQGELMHDYQRLPPYLQRLEALVLAAREIAAAAREPAGGGYELESARKLVRTMAAWWPSAPEALLAIPDPERRLAARALADLDVVNRWGGS
ncbi:hypothetical protein [Nonomuraea sp. NEAU-A123]|uniref:hypothetical protein n=1 Tax=Nonomuraea sp. NEAU-A123 TaxID=2839649 RepID=UPI001BE3FFB4|nr:hypothetical protein [Nonomuraea sp. NEAU-A123]MBT2234424.1 hypothetical protein [Nonomuraea sp. NEAU-A123]